MAKGPFPVLMAPSLPGWGPSCCGRGYISAGYAANDGMDDAAALAQLYPEYDFALIPRRAWVVSLVLDYLETLPQVDMKHVGLFGYSRDGKQAAIAAALDERIAAVIAGSTGVAESAVASFRRAQLWRGDREHHTQLPNLVCPAVCVSFRTRGPFAHRRQSSGGDDRPRAALLEYGLNDEVSNTWGDEQAYNSALKVYKLLGQPDRLGIMHVPGFHGANDQEMCLDWLDIQFGRSTRTWTNNLLFPWISTSGVLAARRLWI